MMQQPLSDYLSFYREQIELELQRSFPTTWSIPKPLHKAMEYSLLGGGKRMRPILLLAAVEALDGSVKEAMPVACAVEMIHTYSLIHDDLPAMDDDDYRRGKLTNHKVHGEAMAILAGDALLTHAFYVIAHTGRKTKMSASLVLKLIEELSRLAGPSGMVGGQAFDMQAMQSTITIEELELLHRHKTGDLITFALKAGGMIGGANEKQLQALEQFGYHIGLAFPNSRRLA